MLKKLRSILPVCLFLTLVLSACSSQQDIPYLLNIAPLAPVLPTPTTAPPVGSPVSSSNLEQMPAVVTSLPPQPTVTPTPDICSEISGSIQKDAIYTDLLPKPMTYNVYLPPCYASGEAKSYPVIYLLHGQGATEDQWIRVGAAAAADKILAAGETQPFIIVFPFDYTYKQPNEYNFEQVFIQLLVPKIDATYRTIPDPAHRSIGGLSRGGAWALHLGSIYPNLFGAIGGHSPAIFYADQNSLRTRLLTMPAANMPRIWLDSGDQDSQQNIIEPFEEFLSKNSIPHEWHEYPGWHEEKYWSAHVEEYLRWYAAGWNTRN